MAHTHDRTTNGQAILDGRGHARSTRCCLLDEFPTISGPTLAELINDALASIGADSARR